MINPEEILRSMLLIRRTEEEIINRYAKQQIRCPVHLSIGQEAIAVGVCHNLKTEDKVFSTHRCHAHYLAKKGSLERMALELHGKVGGCMDGRGGSMHLMDKSVNVISTPIVASAIPLAVGAALANKMDGSDNIVVCFFGDAAVEEGVFHESMNFASLMQLPIIFVCENNQYSVDTHLSKRQPDRDFRALGAAHKMSTMCIDGDDVFKVIALMDERIESARVNIPQFVILNTNRSHVHCGIDKEFELKRDPLETVTCMFTIEENARIDAEIKEQITLAFDAAEVAPLPAPDMAKAYIYA